MTSNASVDPISALLKSELAAVTGEPIAAFGDDALLSEVGLDSLGAFRITSPGGNTLDFEASAEVTMAGGGNNDAASFQAVIRVSGPITFG